MDLIQRNNDTILHMTMSCVGGFTGVYAIMLRDHNFGQAATGNLLELFSRIVIGHSWYEVLWRATALGLFALFLGLAHMLERRLPGRSRLICILAEYAGILITGLIPSSAPPIPALFPVFALTAFQWGSFAGARGFSCSTIFSSNNLKQTVFAFQDYRHTGDPRMKEKFFFFLSTLICFYASATAGAYLVLHLGARSIWLCWIPLSLALYLTLAAVRQPKEEISPCSPSSAIVK